MSLPVVESLHVEFISGCVVNSVRLFPLSQSVYSVGVQVSVVEDVIWAMKYVICGPLFISVLFSLYPRRETYLHRRRRYPAELVKDTPLFWALGLSRYCQGPVPEGDGLYLGEKDAICSSAPLLWMVHRPMSHLMFVMGL